MKHACTVCDTSCDEKSHPFAPRDGLTYGFALYTTFGLHLLGMPHRRVLGISATTNMTAYTDVLTLLVVGGTLEAELP